MMEPGVFPITATKSQQNVSMENAKSSRVSTENVPRKQTENK